MGFHGELISVYTKHMRITQGFIAGLIGKVDGTISNWKNGTSEPSLDDLDLLASKTGTQTDWWLGRRVLTMWGPDIQALQDSLLDAAPTIEALDMVERSVKVIRYMQENSEYCEQEWFMAGAIGLPVSEFRRLMTELPDDMSPITLKRLSEFTLLHSDWLMDGDADMLTRSPRLGEYLPFAQRCVEDGFTGPELIASYDDIRRKLTQQRRMRNAGTEK